MPQESVTSQLVTSWYVWPPASIRWKTQLRMTVVSGKAWWMPNSLNTLKLYFCAPMATVFCLGSYLPADFSHSGIVCVCFTPSESCLCFFLVGEKRKGQISSHVSILHFFPFRENLSPRVIMAIFYEKTHRPQARQQPMAAPIPGMSTHWVLAFLRSSIFRCSWKSAVPVLLDQLYSLKKNIKMICCHLGKSGGQPYPLPSSSSPALSTFPGPLPQPALFILLHVLHIFA